MRDDIVAAAREYLDTPFVHQGRVKGVGIDCAGDLQGFFGDERSAEFGTRGHVGKGAGKQWPSEGQVKCR